MYSMLLHFFSFWSQTPTLYCQPHLVAWSPRVLGRFNFGSFCWNYFRMRPTQRSSLGREPMASSNSLIQMKSRENGERGNQNQTWITTRWAEHWGQLQVVFFLSQSYFIYSTRHPICLSVWMGVFSRILVACLLLKSRKFMNLQVENLQDLYWKKCILQTIFETLQCYFFLPIYAPKSLILNRI